MADGNQTVTRQFIAYQDEEHGLGHQIARSLIQPNSHERASPRRTAHQVMATLIGKQASKAVVPLQNDLGGYDKRTLESLLDFVGWRITGAIAEKDNYVLAVPTCQVLELGESNFPSAFQSRSHAVGNLPKNRESQAMLYNRIGRIHATADAKDRCAAALDGFEAQGIKVSQLSDKENAYRKVLEIANQGLDPDRQVTTHYNDLTNTVERASRLSGQNYAKSLDAVLLPRNAVTLSGGRDSEQYDYVIVDDHLEGDLPIETRFLVIERVPPFKLTKKRVTSQAKLYEKWAGAVGSAFGNKPLQDVDGPKPWEFVRVLMKINSRGDGVKDVGLFTKKLTDRGIPYAMTVLNDRPETLPVVFEIEVENSAEARNKIKAFFRDIQFECKAWDLKYLGAYGTNAGFPDSARNTQSSDSFGEKVRNWAIPALIAVIAILAALLFFNRDGPPTSALPAPVEPTRNVAAPEKVNKPEPVLAGGITTGAPINIEPVVEAPAVFLSDPVDVEFAAVRSIPETWWICGNKDLVTSSENSAQCVGDTAPATYADSARISFSTQNLADSLVQNPTVRRQLCGAHTLVVTGSASSSPFEQNDGLPARRAENWAGSLQQSLAAKCGKAAPAILPLSLGVAATASDQTADRQLLIVTASAPRDAVLSGPAIEEQFSSWLASAELPREKTPLFDRMNDPRVFDADDAVWLNSAAAANIHDGSN